jgi:hypothetical protein
MGLQATAMSQGVRGKLATLLFLIALLFGNTSLIAGLEREGGLPAAGIFALVCLVWWISFRISRSADGRGMTLGFVALGLWILNLIGALVFAFRHSIGDRFFWASVAILLVLIAGIAISDTQSDVTKTKPSPG